MDMNCSLNSESPDNRQSAYHQNRIARSDDVDRDIVEAMKAYLCADLGLGASFAEQRAREELARKIPKSVIRELDARGIFCSGAEVLDLGAGLGAMSEELLLAGAKVISLEPGGAWADLTRRRLERHAGHFRLVNAFGEAIPLPDQSVDLIVSLQVLEHVQDPSRVLAEALRVLRPGGHFYLSCENYLAFREAHYQLPWLPLLPKTIGKLYLRLLGRSPRFLEEAITYTTFPGVVGECRRLGFIRLRDEEIARNIQSKQGAKWQFLRFVARLFGARGPILLDDAMLAFKFGIRELLRRPSGDNAAPRR